MYATIVSDAELAQGSILVPTKALIQLLNKDMLDVIVDGRYSRKQSRLAQPMDYIQLLKAALM